VKIGKFFEVFYCGLGVKGWLLATGKCLIGDLLEIFVFGLIGDLLVLLVALLWLLSDLADFVGDIPLFSASSYSNIDLQLGSFLNKCLELSSFLIIFP
jgi:hypothetical protein